MSTNSNHFTKVAQDVQGAPQGQRIDKLIEGIAQQMQSSSTPQTQELGNELWSLKPQLAQACGQGQQSK